MTHTVRDLAALVQGQIHGDGEQAIKAARSITEAGPGDITFIENEKHARVLASCQASAAVVPLTMPLNGLTLIRVNDPLAAFIHIVQHLQNKSKHVPHGIDPRAFVHPSAQIGADVSIHPFAYVGEGSVLGARCILHPGVVVGRHCRLGDDVVLHPHVVLYEDTVLGDRVIVHANAVLGADGFGYRQHQGRHIKVPQLGNVEIGDDVEIGACTTIDRGTFQPTRIGPGTKIDNLVMVAHNCQVGPHNLLVSQVGIAGSTSTGSHVVIAGQAGVADHVHIGDRAILGARTGANNDLDGDARYLGAPALPERDQKRIFATVARLPEMRKDLQKIKAHLGME